MVAQGDAVSGELPLLKELSSLKRVRSLRDPSTMGVACEIVTPSTRSIKSSASNAKVARIRRAGHGVVCCSGKGGYSNSLRKKSPQLHPKTMVVSDELCKPFYHPISLKEMRASESEQGSLGNRSRPFSSVRESRISSKWRFPATDERFVTTSRAGWDSDSMEASFASCPPLQNANAPLQRYSYGGSRPTKHSANDSHLITRGKSRSDFVLPASPSIRLQQNDVNRFLTGRATETTDEKLLNRAMARNQCAARVSSPLLMSSLDESCDRSTDSRTTICLGSRMLGHQGPNQTTTWKSMVVENGTSPKRGFSKMASIKGRHVLNMSSASTSQRTMALSSPSRTYNDGDGLHPTDDDDDDDELDVCELPKHSCGIPCYWRKNQKKVGKHPSDMIVDDYKSPNNHNSRFSSPKRFPGGPQTEPARRKLSLQLEALPLLSETSIASGDAICSSTEDNNSVSGELELNDDVASSRATQKRCGCFDEEAEKGVVDAISNFTISTARSLSLSQKYRPMCFADLIGQNLVAHALSNAVSKKKVAPVYLFQGPRGTGKTSAARIFASALNCAGKTDRKPCGNCKQCILSAHGKSSDIREVDAASSDGVENVRALLHMASSAPASSEFKVFIVDECHMLTSDAWNAVLKLLEEPPQNVTFILITTAPEKLPSTAISRCQKFPFLKIKEVEIASRLQKLSELENLDVELGALELIASRADGSLRDAENILDQLSLLGQNITVSIVHELFGSVSDEKLLDLLDAAFRSDTINTVQIARELIDSGVEPLDLMVQLASLITDIIAGSSGVVKANQQGNTSLGEEEVERLQAALKILSEAEKQLRSSSNDRRTWLTAALLQFGQGKLGIGSTARRKGQMNRKKLNDLLSNRIRSSLHGLESFAGNTTHCGTHRQKMNQNSLTVHPEHQGNLESIWSKVLESSTSPVRQLLQNHVRLLALSISADNAAALLELTNKTHLFREKEIRGALVDAFQSVLGHHVVVQMTAASNPAGITEFIAKEQVVLLREDPLACPKEKPSIDASAFLRPNQNGSPQMIENAFSAYTSFFTIPSTPNNNDFRGTTPLPTEPPKSMQKEAITLYDRIHDDEGAWNRPQAARTSVIDGINCYESNNCTGVDVPFHSCVIEEENMRLESQSKYGCLLCWREPKVRKDEDQNGCGMLMRVLPCVKRERWSIRI